MVDVLILFFSAAWALVGGGGDGFGGVFSSGVVGGVIGNGGRFSCLGRFCGVACGGGGGGMGLFLP